MTKHLQGNLSAGGQLHRVVDMPVQTQPTWWHSALTHCHIFTLCTAFSSGAATCVRLVMTRQVEAVLDDVASCAAASSFNVEQRHAADKALMSNVASLPQAMGATFLSRLVASHRAVHRDACARHLDSLPVKRVKRDWKCFAGQHYSYYQARAKRNMQRSVQQCV